MKTKPFLLATAGATVDGRTIDENMLTEMAETYNPQTYGARLNIEHFRGITPNGPFRAYGDVLELSTDTVDVAIGGKTEKRLGLFGTLDVDDEAKALNDAGQKVYPSIEIQPNFGGSGKAYLMGVALTDSPASIGTERMKFNRSLPDTLKVPTDAPELAFAIEFADAGTPSTAASDGFFAKLGDILENHFGKREPEAKKPAAKPEGEGEDVSLQFQAILTEMAKEFSAALATVETRMAEQNDQFQVQLRKLETSIETTPVDTFTPRPAAAGSHGSTVKTDC